MGRQRALVCLLSPLEPSAVEEGLLPVLPVLVRHHRVVLASVRDPELERMARSRDGLDEVYAAAAAEQTLARRRRTADLLGALGVDVIDVPAEALAPGPRRPLPRAQGPRAALSVSCQDWVATRSSRRRGSTSPV